MYFRKEKVDEIKVVESDSDVKLCQKIEYLAKQNIIVDVQYNVRTIGRTLSIDIYSALVLLRRKQ